MRGTVTGGLGFIGSHLCDLLAAQGHQLHVIDDARSAVANPPRTATLQSRAVHEAYWQPADVIIHLAGPVGPVGVISQAGHITRDIIRDAVVVRDAALAFGARLVYVSTSEVYGEQTQPIAEDAPRIIAAGHSARMEYATAKLAAETMLLNTSHLDVRIVRPFNVAGPRQKPDGGFVLPRFIRQAQADGLLTVYEPGTQRRAFTHVADIVDGIWRAAQHGPAREVYNLGNPANECSIRELATDVVEIVGRGRPVIVDPHALWGPRFAEAPDKIPDIRKAQRLLGWYPTRDRETVIRDACAT